MKSFVLILCVAVIACVWADDGCTQGETKKLDCNTCKCGNGNWLCTQMACPSHHHQRRSPDDSCQPGEVKQERCNSCRCIDGKFACTRRACPPEGRRRRAAPTPDNCTPGERFMDKCNQCTCGPDGKTARCTYRLCPQ
ncbi:serine protease inhibitor I/II-like [Atheta coriaria]|uniref:serine protease inhibitor I/II-like n=1 Tax=Dalotia coriaria TaxID=877792 RepID=UPI0031F43331